MGFPINTNDGNKLSVPAASAIAVAIAVYVNSSGNASISGVDDPVDGFTENPSTAAGEMLTISLKNTGSTRATASGTIANGSRVYQAVAGKVTASETGLGSYIGRAISAATDGQQVTILFDSPIKSVRNLTLASGQTAVIGSRVKLSSTAGEIAICGVADVGIGSAVTAGAAGTSIPVRLDAGTLVQQAVASVAIAVAGNVFSAASGKVATTGATGAFRLGSAITSSAADGDLITFIRSGATGAAA